jgi:RNA polymerase sigma-70 factor, ECF subfamily
MTDDDLMLSARNGGHAEFEALVRRHRARVFRLAARYLGDLSLAHDVTQAAFLELYRSRERYQPQGKFLAYLGQITLNQCRMMVRATRTCRPHFDVDTGGSSLESLSGCERRRDLELALARLSDKLRSVVLLRYGGDAELAQIADTLDIPIGTVKRRLFDAMSQMRAFLTV